MSDGRPSKAGRGLFANSFAVLGTCHITSVLGYFFWLVCAHGVSASTIGVSSTVIATMTLVAVVAAAGLEPLLTRVLPGADPESRSGLSSTAVVFTVVVSGVVGAAGALLLPDGIQTAVGSGWLVGMLGAGAVGTALLLVINAALLGARRAELALLGSALGSILRLVTVVVLLSVGTMAAGAEANAARTILAIWVVSLLVSSGLSFRMLVGVTPGFRFRPSRNWLLRLRHEVGWDHVTMLAARLPGLTLPILASSLFPPDQVGYLVMALMISGVFFAVSASVANSLLADCADRSEFLRIQARRALRLTLLLLVAPVTVACLLAAEVLGLFGADYAQHSALLVLLLLATLPDALVNLAVAILRVRRRLAVAATVTIAAAVLALGGAWSLMPHMGIIGAGWSALASPLIVATALVAVGYFRATAEPLAGNAHDASLARGTDSVIAATTRQNVGIPENANRMEP